MRSAAVILAAAAGGAAAFDVEEANRTLHLAYAAGCGEDVLKAWSCPVSCKAPYGVPGVALQEFLQNKVAGTQGYVGIDAAGKRVIVSYRGTDDWQNDIQDADFPMSAAYGTEKGVDGAKLDSGFWLAYKTLRAGTLAAVDAALEKCVGCSVLFTGHSLGCAMATIGASDMASSNSSAPVSFYGFACPRTGNAAFVAWYAGLPLASSFRMRRQRDIVPAVPPRSIGYRHVGTEIYNTHNKDDGDDSYVVCDPSGEDPKCGDAEETPPFPLDLLHMSGKEHCKYMGWDGCSCGGNPAPPTPPAPTMPPAPASCKDAPSACDPCCSGSCLPCVQCVDNKAGACAWCWSPGDGDCLGDDQTKCQSCWGATTPPPAPPAPAGCKGASSACDPCCSGTCLPCAACTANKAGACAECWAPSTGAPCLSDDKTKCQSCWGPAP